MIKRINKLVGCFQSERPSRQNKARKKRSKPVQDIVEKAEKELMKIRALCDVISTVDACDFERNTLSCLGEIIKEAGERLFEYVKQGACK